MNDFAFIVTDSFVKHVTIQFGFDTYEEARKVLTRKLASNWSVVTDEKEIQSYILDNEKYIDELSKSDLYKDHLKGLNLLIKQHSKTDVVLMTEPKKEDIVEQLIAAKDYTDNKAAMVVLENAIQFINRE
jgi:hypothetical protein